MLKKRIIIIVAAACCACAAVIWILWAEGVFLPPWINWEEKRAAAENPPLEAELKARRVTIFSDGQKIWESPFEYKVQDLLLCDIDHDGEEDILLLCWKIGRYGDHKPFYIKEDEKNWSQHIFIYSIEDGAVKAKWMASYLPFDVLRWEFQENDRLLLTDLAGNVTRWDWLQWGLEIMEEPGS